ncbi:MAG TPA: hypothetical protein VK665_11260 [Candidatus Elarobacter sp.]|nr:hypothetical protein [Candidatus Elarobacter sp.]
MKAPFGIAALVAALATPSSLGAAAAPADAPAAEPVPVRLMSETVFATTDATRGPDQYMYLYAYRTRPGAAVAGARPFAMRELAMLALERAVGIAIYESAPPAGKPVWVFSGGAVADVARGRWHPDTISAMPDKRAHLRIGTPSPEVLPPPLRRAIAEHMRIVDHVETPKIAMMIADDASGTPDGRYYVAVNLRRSAYATQDAWTDALHRIEWFIPPSLVFFRPPMNEPGFEQLFSGVEPLSP